jgi:hypothetical protein
MPNWIKDAVIKRFDERSIQSEKIDDMEMIRNRLLELEQEINSKLSECDQEIIHEWLDLYVRMAAVQNEWLYLKGIQDGMHMLMYVELDRH